MDNRIIITTNVEKQTHNSKPTHQAGAIRNILGEKSATVTLSAKSFAKIITEGGNSFTLGVMNGRNDADWGGNQRLFAVDIDNKNDCPKETLESLLDKFQNLGINIYLIYETFSSTEECRKYRVLIISETPFSDGEQVKKINEALINISPQADASCKNLSRMYYGSNKGEAYLNIVTTPNSVLINLADNYEQAKAKVDKKINNNAQNYNNSVSNTTSRLGNEIRNFDLCEFVQNDTNQIGIAVKEGIMLPVCPICGHNNDFTVSKEKNLFYCHSVNGEVGGNIITYLSHTRKVDNKKANRIFDIIKKGDFRDYLYKLQDPSAGAPSYITIHNDVEKVHPELLADYIKNNYMYYIAENKSQKTDVYWHDGTIYKRLSDNAVKSKIRSIIACYRKTLVDTSCINNTFQLMLMDEDTIPDSKFNADESIIVFENGVLNINTMELLPHSPDYLSTIKIPCNWNNDSVYAPVFNEYMDTLTGGKEELRKLLLMFMGLAISNVSCARLKKSLFICGKGNSGKSVIRDLTERLVGEENCANLDLNQIESQFLLNEIFGKRLVGSADMSFQVLKGMNRFKLLTGGDSIFADVKNTN